MPGVTLDTGALIAVERGDARMAALLAEAKRSGVPVSVPAGVIAQAWRGSARQARLSRLLALPIVEEATLDGGQARAAGALCARAGTRDVIDASVVICARLRGHAVVTSDTRDIARLDPRLKLVEL